MNYKRLMQFIQSAEFCAQSAHFFAAMTIVLLGSEFCDHYYTGFWILQLWSVPKELVFDCFSFGEGHGSPDLLDLLFYEIGGCVALLILFVHGMCMI